MRIGFFTDTYTPSINGVITSILTFKKEIEKMGHEVYVFAPVIPGAPKHEPRTYRFPSVPSLAYPDIRESLPLSPKILAEIPKLKLDLLHIQTPGEIGLLGTHLAIRYQIPLVFSYHTSYPEYFSVYKKATASLILGMLAYPMIIMNPRAYKDLLKVVSSIKLSKTWTREIAEKLSVVFSNQTDGVIAPSPKIKKLLLKWGVKKPVVVIPTGINLEEVIGKRGDYKKKLRMGKEDPLVAYMGRLGEEKNVDLLLKAFAHTGHKIPKARLIIIGDGPYKKNLEQLAHRLKINKKTTFTGFVDAKVKGNILKSADVFVFPSLTDTQGISVLEAAANGLPIILVDRGITDALKEGQNGFYAQNDPHNLAKKIERVLSDKKLRAKFSKNSKIFVKKYTASKLTRELLAFYKKVIDDKKRTARGNKKTLF